MKHSVKMRILAGISMMAVTACWSGTNVYAAYDPATNTDTFTNQKVGNYNYPERNLVIKWNNNAPGDGAPIRDVTVKAKSISIDTNFAGNGFNDKGVISDKKSTITASNIIKIVAHNDAVYTEGNGSTTIDGFKNLTIEAPENFLGYGGYGVVDNGGGITIQGGNDSTVNISTKASYQAAVGNSVKPAYANSVGTGVTISANTIILDAPRLAVFAGAGKNGDFAVNLNASTININGAVDAAGGNVSINSDTNGSVTITKGTWQGSWFVPAVPYSILATGNTSHVIINKNQGGLVQITGDVQANTGASIDLNLAGNKSFLEGNLKTDVSSGESYKDNDNASITARFTGTNAQMTGNIQTVTDHSTITADFSGENGTLTGDAKATGVAPTNNDGTWNSASGTTLNLSMTGANTSQTGNLLADGNNTLNANYTGTNSSLTGNADNTGIMNLTFDNQSQMSGNMTNGHADYNDGTSFDGKLGADFNNGSRWNGDLNSTSGTANIRLNNSSVWNGAASGNGDINLAGGSLWALTKDSMANSVNPDGSSIISLAGTARKLETQSLGGSGGTFLMDLKYQGDDVNTYRDGDSSDFIVAHGGNGSTYNVALSGDSSVNGMTEGSKLYFASTAANSSVFKLNQNIEVQNYNKIYNKNLSVLKDTNNLSVKKDTDTSNSDLKGFDNWFLTPDASKGHDGDTINPNGIVPGSAANAAFALWRDDDTLLKRLGELRYQQQDEGVWARMVNKHLERDGHHAFHGNYKTLQVGYDKKKTTANDGNWYYGGAISHLWGNTGYTDGHGSEKATALSLYATNIRPHGHYLDLITKVGRIDSDYSTSYRDHGKFENWGTSIGAEYGRKNMLKAGWSIEPQAQLTYHYLWGDDYTTSNGAKVSQDNADSLVGRLGFVLGKDFNVGTPNVGRVYLKASVLHDFLGSTGSSITDDLTYHDDDDLGDTWYVAGIGTNIHFGKDNQFYFDAERNFNADVSMKYRFNAGFRFGF